MEQTQQNFDKAREAFPRFCLLNDDELKVALSAPIKIAVQAAAPMVFQAAHDMDFNESGEIVGFFGQGADPSDQVIKFLEPVKCGDDRTATFIQLHAAMVARVKQDMHAQIAQNEWSVDKKPVGIAEAVLIADEVFYCKMAEEAITSGGLYVALDQITGMLNKLIDHSKVEKSDGMHKMHSARIIIAVAWKRRISQLTAGSCNKLDLFFKSFSRFYLEKDQIVCKTAEASFEKIGEHQLHHHYEYQGMCGLLVVTQMTEKLNFAYAEALGTGKGHAALGPAGTGKTEAAKDFAKKLGRRMVVISCSHELLIGQIKSTFNAARRGGFWMCMDEFNRIPIEGIEDLLKHFASGHLPKQETGYFITHNPGYAGRSHVQLNPHEWMVNHISVPSVNEIAQIMLATAGFHSYEEMGTRLMKWQYNSIWKLSKADQYNWDLRIVRQIIQCATTRVQKHGENEEVAMINAIVISVVPSLLPEDVEIHYEIMKSVGLDISGHTRPMNAKATHPTFPKEQFQYLCACFALMLEQRHAIQIIGHGHKFVEAIAEAENYHVVKIDIDTEPEADGFSFGHNLNGPSKWGYEFNKDVAANSKGGIGVWLYGRQEEGVWREGAFQKAMKEVTSGETSKKQGLKLIHIKCHHLNAILAENLNPVFDDNKAYTSANGEVFALPNDVKIVCEVAHFKQESPATVSRTGNIFFTHE